MMSGHYWGQSIVNLIDFIHIKLILSNARPPAIYKLNLYKFLESQ